MVDTEEFGARLLVARYHAVSSKGRFENYTQVFDLAELSNSLNKLPLHRYLVNKSLKYLFEVVAENFDELAYSPASWPAFDAAVLEAVNYVAKGDEASDAMRIAGAVDAARIAWVGL